MNFNDFSPELKEKAKSCKTREELEVAGGSIWCKCYGENTCESHHRQRTKKI